MPTWVERSSRSNLSRLSPELASEAEARKLTCAFRASAVMMTWRLVSSNWSISLMRGRRFFSARLKACFWVTVSGCRPALTSLSSSLSWRFSLVLVGAPMVTLKLSSEVW